MTEPTGHEITELLQAWREGDERALEKLTPEVYRELLRIGWLCINKSARTAVPSSTPEPRSNGKLR